MERSENEKIHKRARVRVRRDGFAAFENTASEGAKGADRVIHHTWPDRASEWA